MRALGIGMGMNMPAGVGLPPLSNIEQVIILGASIEAYSFGPSINTQNTEVVLAQNRVQAATGKTVVIRQYAVAGQTLAGMMSDSVPKVMSEQAGLPGNGRTLVIIGIGGNTITENRPLTASVMATARAQLLDAIGQIEAKGWEWCLFDLSWRNYDSPLCQYDRSQGSWPWITDVSRAINIARKRRWGRTWVYPNGASWCDLYSFYRNNKQILAAGDPVHPQDYALTRDYIVDSAIIAAIKGVPAAQRFPRDETYALGFTAQAPESTGNTVSLRTTSTHQGMAHVGVYAAGSAPTAAQVIAGNGTGFIAKVNALRDGTTIDAPVKQTVSGLQVSTAYRVCAVFVADSLQTSAVQSANVSTSATPDPAGSDPVVILFRKAALTSPRANINQLTLAEGPTTTGVKLSNAVNTAGVASGIALSTTAPFSEQGDTGNSALSVPGFFNAEELNQFWYVDSPTAAVSLSGLTPSRSYTLTLAASRNVASTETNRAGDVTITAGTVTNGAASRVLNAVNPASGSTAGSVQFVVTSTAGGGISFTLARISGSTGFAYLGGIHIQPQ